MNSENFIIDDLDFDDLNNIQIVKKNYKEVAKSKSEYLDILTYIQQIDSYSDAKKLKNLLLNVSNENIKKLMPHIIHYYISNKAEFLQILNKFNFSQTINSVMKFDQITLNIDNEECVIPILYKTSPKVIDDFETIYNNFEMQNNCDAYFNDLAAYFLYGKTSNNDLVQLFNNTFIYTVDKDRRFSDKEKIEYTNNLWNSYITVPTFEENCEIYKYIYNNFFDKTNYDLQRITYDKSKKFIYVYVWPHYDTNLLHKIMIIPYFQNLTLSDISIEDKQIGKKSKKNLKLLLKTEYNITFPPNESYSKLNNTPAIVYHLTLNEESSYKIIKKINQCKDNAEKYGYYNFHIFEQYIDKKVSGGVVTTNKLLSFINTLWLFSKEFDLSTSALNQYFQINSLTNKTQKETIFSVRYHVGNKYLLVLSIKELVNLTTQMKIYIIDNTNQDIISNQEFLSNIKK